MSPMKARMADTAWAGTKCTGEAKQPSKENGAVSKKKREHPCNPALMQTTAGNRVGAIRKPTRRVTGKMEAEQTNGAD